MIFVTVGTGKFDKLAKAADKLAGQIKEKMVIQVGQSDFRPKNAEWFTLSKDYMKYYNGARIIISHGGAGSTLAALGAGKKLIGVANLDRTDSHQEEILEELEKRGHLIFCKDFDLKKSLERAEKFKFKKYKKPGFWADKEIIKFLGD